MTTLGTFTTRTGQEVELRLIKKGEAGLLVDLFHRLSPESKRLRFHLYATRLPEELIWGEAEHLSDLDPRRQVARMSRSPSRS